MRQEQRDLDRKTRGQYFPLILQENICPLTVIETLDPVHFGVVYKPGLENSVSKFHTESKPINGGLTMIALWRIILFAALMFSSKIILAADYLYVENPDPKKYTISWQGSGPNCHEKNAMETFGWIIHESSIQVDLKLKKDYLDGYKFPALCSIYFHPRRSIFARQVKLSGEHCEMLKGKAGNTFWITVKPYKPHMTWICG